MSIFGPGGPDFTGDQFFRDTPTPLNLEATHGDGLCDSEPTELSGATGYSPPAEFSVLGEITLPAEGPPT